MKKKRSEMATSRSEVDQARTIRITPICMQMPQQRYIDDKPRVMESTNKKWHLRDGCSVRKLIDVQFRLEVSEQKFDLTPPPWLK